LRAYHFRACVAAVATRIREAKLPFFELYEGLTVKLSKPGVSARLATIESCACKSSAWIELGELDRQQRFDQIRDLIVAEATVVRTVVKCDNGKCDGDAQVGAVRSQREQP